MDEPAAVMAVPGDVDFGGSGAFGATNFGSTSFGSTLVVIAAGVEGLAAPLPAALLTRTSPVFAAAGRVGTCEPLETGGRTAAGAGGGAEPIRSPGKRMPQKPTAASVNSNST